MWRLAIALLLFLISLLVFFKAPTSFFWKVAIATIEFPFIPILLSIAFLIYCLYGNSNKLVLISLTSFSILFYSLPIIEAYIRGKNLEQDLQNNFPFQTNNSFLSKPFSLIKLFSGLGIEKKLPKILVYKKIDEKDLAIDFYSASLSSKRPCVVVIHGGSWSGGDSKQLPDLNFYLSQQGYHVAAINYRLAPKYKSPSQINDTQDALNYLIDHSESLKIDTNNFVFLGRSAGAQIALMAAYTFKSNAIKGAISLYGPLDMVWGASIKANKLVLNTDQVFINYFGGLVNEVPEKYQEASVIEHSNSSSPPTLLIHGPNDPMVSYYHSVHLNTKLEEEKVPHYFLNLPWATHGCDYNINGPSGQISTFAIERFINSVTNNTWKN